MNKKDSAHSFMKELITKAAKAEIQKAKEGRSYKQEETMPLPQGIDGISFGHKKTSKAMPKVVVQKKKGLNLEQLHCSQNQNSPLFFIEKAEALQLKKVHSVKAKERLIALRNLRRMSHRMQKWMHQEVKVLGKDSAAFTDLIQRREERLFQIDRTIRYLGNI